MDVKALFIFGVGFSARAVVEAIKAADIGTALAGTTRDQAKADALRASGVNAHVFDGVHPGATLLPDLSETTHLLVSVAPNQDGDPVLAAHFDHILAAPKLEWIGYFSTIGVYGDADGAWIDESGQTHGDNDRLARRLEAEAGWADLAQKRGTPLAILRLAGIYGPGRSAFDKLRAGTARRINKPGQVFNRIYAPDIGAITLKAARHGLAGVYNLTDLEPSPPQDVIGYAASLLGIDPPPETPFAEAGLGPMARSFYGSNRRVSSQRIRTALSYELIAPTYREGLAAILETERDTDRAD